MKYHIMFLPEKGTGILQPVYIDDLIEGMLHAWKKGKTGETDIIACPETVTVQEYFLYLARMIGKKRLPSVPQRASLMFGSIAEVISGLTDIPIITREAIRGVMMKAEYDIEKAKR